MSGNLALMCALWKPLKLLDSGFANSISALQTKFLVFVVLRFRFEPAKRLSG
jgi:hypothetical protein